MSDESCPNCGYDMVLVKADKGKIGWRWFCAFCYKYFSWKVVKSG